MQPLDRRGSFKEIGIPIIKEGMSSFKDLEKPLKFEFENAFTWGVEKGKFGGFTIPVSLNPEDAEKIDDLAKENGAKNPVYGGKTIYLKTTGLTAKQKKELLNEGRTNILVHFEFTGTYTKDGVSYLTHKVTKLRKLDSEDDMPED